jgi:N-acetyl-gamma-glutamyl-phosphate reductase
MGVTGYTGAETVQCLARHRNARITSLSVRSEEPVKYPSVYPAMGKVVDLECSKINIDDISDKCDVVFLALPHTVSMEYAGTLVERGKKVIDLSADYRLPADVYEKWFGTAHIDKAHLSRAVYGLPELNRDKIRGASFVANPGCYPTSVALALLPIAGILAAKGVEPIIDSKSGTTGAGKKNQANLMFSEVQDNFRCYKANDHQHIPEIESVLSCAAGRDLKVHFTPHLLPIRRGIMSTIYIPHAGFPPAEELHKMYSEKYAKEPFVRVSPPGEFPEIAHVANTNFCDIGIKVARGLIIIVSVLDNLLKGASGQAVENMNIMCGFDEKEGLV